MLQTMLLLRLFPRGTFSRWKAGRSRNYCEHIGAISEFLGVSAEYLVTGSEDGKFVASTEEQHMLNCFRNLPPEKRETIVKMIKWLAE